MSARVLPVGAFVHLFRELLESDPLYADLWLEGEVSDFSRSSAGHTYFTLRDEDGCLKCVLFRNQALRLSQLPTLGAQIAVHGGLSVYPRSGAVQLVVDLVQPAGIGAAALELEYLRQRLEAEGFFDPSRKRPVPAWPRRIGVVTSSYGAAWHDIQAVVARRFPLAELVLSPAQVQGDGAAASLVRALDRLQDDDRVEVVILARGGGDSDDLSAFNEERVARAVFACRVPVVAGIGHATDQTLVERVADDFAPTPSAAAEICVPSATELLDRIAALRDQLIGVTAAHIEAFATAARSAEHRLVAASPRSALAIQRQTVSAGCLRLRISRDAYLTYRKHDLETSEALLRALDPHAVLERGYAALHCAMDRTPLFSVSQVQQGDRIVAVLADGAMTSVIEHRSTQATHPEKSATRS